MITPWILKTNYTFFSSLPLLAGLFNGNYLLNNLIRSLASLVQIAADEMHEFQKMRNKSFLKEIVRDDG